MLGQPEDNQKLLKKTDKADSEQSEKHLLVFLVQKRKKK